MSKLSAYEMRKVVIIGAGMGGLATALRLAYQGYQVTIYEKQPLPGGRSNLLAEDGYRFDMGPTILVMKEAFEDTYQAIGQDFNQRLNLVQLDPNYRIYYHDGTYLDLHSNMAQLAREVEKIEPGSAERLFRFLGESAQKYELGMKFVDRNYDRVTDLVNPKALIELVGTKSYQNLYQQVADSFKNNDKLSKAFSFHSMFLGLSPFDALAMYSLITYADLSLGMWFPKGGIYRIIEDMLVLAEEMGVRIQTNAAVEEIMVNSGKVSGVRLSSGEQVEADIVISNADLPFTYRKLLNGHGGKEFPRSKLDRMAYACSGYILYLGVDRTYPHMQHQSLYFSEDYKANLEAIFNKKSLPADPSFHLSIPSITDPSLAPEGHSAIYVLAPMPNLSADIDWDQAAPIIRGQLLDQLEKIIDPDLREHITLEREYRPTDWESDINAALGTAFGSFSHDFFQSSYFRPHNKSKNIAGLYFVGQSTYPGIGMPMVHISAKLAAERIFEEWH
jgi:phytoene desaturase